MITKNKNVLRTVRNKIPHFSQLLLLISFSINKSPLFIFLTIVPKYIPILIITSHLTWKLDEETKNDFYISNYLRKIELVNILPNLTMKSFYFISIILFIIEFTFFLFLIQYYLKIRKKKSAHLSLHWYPKLMFYLNTLFSQYIIEFYSFTFVICIKDKLTLPTNLIYKDYLKISIILSNSNYNNILIGILSFIHGFFLIIMNIFIFYSLVIINSSFRTEKPTLRINHLYKFYFFVLFTDLSAIEYYEIFLTENGRFKFNSLLHCFLFIILIIDNISNIRTYEENNFFFIIMGFLNNYNLTSIFFEFISVIEDFHFSLKETFIFLLFKFFLTISTFYCLIFIRSHYMLKLSKNYLFDILVESKLNQILECFNYLLDILIDIKIGKNNANEIINVIILHQKKCTNEKCKCKEIKPIPICGIRDNKIFSNKLIKGFGFLMETCFANGNTYINISYTIFLSEYFFNIKENLILAYSILQNCLIQNIKKIDFIQSFQIFSYINFYNEKFKNKFKNSSSALKFYKIYDNIFERMEFNKNIVNYCTSFDNLIGIKMNFENSLKFESDQDTNEILSIDSMFLKREIILDTIKKLTKMSKISKKIKKNLIKYSSEKKGTEFYYLTFLFYTMFSKNIPNDILKTFDNISLGSISFKGLSNEDIAIKFNKYIDKYILSESAMNQLIIKFSKGIKIKYCSSNFCNQLNFNQSQILGKDFSNIFPKNLRRSHTKSILHYLMVNQNYFLQKSTYIFDSNEHFLPCEIRACTIPHFGKSLIMILQILIKKNNTHSFILDNNFNCLSISKEIEKNYFFNLNLLRKCDVEIIDLFDINIKDIQNKFSQSLDIINKIKVEMKYNDIENYSKNLFHLNNDLNNDDKPFIPNKKILEISNSDIIEYKNLFKKENMEFIRSKALIIQNIIKALNKLTDSSEKDENIRNLLDYIYQIKKKSNYDNNLNNRIINLNGSEIILNNEELVNSNETLQLLFKGNIKKIYDIPIYIFRFRDIMNNEEGDKGIEHKNMKNNDNLNLSNNKNSYSIFTNKFPSKNLFSTSSVISSISHSLNKNLDKNLNKEKDKIKKEHMHQHIKKSKFKKLFKLEKLNILLMFICFCLSALNVIFQLIRMNQISIIGLFLYAISRIKDKIIYFQSALLTEMYQFGKFSNMEITEEQMLEYLKMSILNLQDSISEFYLEMIKYDKKIGKNCMSRIYGNFMKISKTWENYTYDSQIFKELYYSIYLTNDAIKDDIKNNIYEDIENYFFNDYRKNLKQEVLSSFIKVLFFSVNNFNEPILVIIKNFLNEVTDYYYSYLKDSQKLVIILEILWLISNLSFFLITFFLFSKFNRRLFKKIIEMFLNEEKNEKGTFKNKPENFYIRQKIRLFIILVHNFTMENKMAFQNFRENFLKGKKKHFDNSSLNNLSNLLNTSSNINSSVNTSINTRSILGSSNINNSSIINKSNASLLINKKNVQFEEKKMTNKETAITNEKLLKLLNQKQITISHFMNIIVLIFFINCFIIFYLHLENTIKFNNRNKILLNSFNSFATYFSTLPSIITSVRKLILTQSSIPNDLLNYNMDITTYEKTINEITSSTDFNIFTKIKYFWEQVNLIMNNSKTNLDYLCNNYMICKNYIKINNGYCSEGIILGYELIAQKFNQIIGDYINILENGNGNISKNDIKNYIMTNIFNRVQENIEFVFSQIQHQFYVSFNEDYSTIRHNLHNLTILLNIVFFFFEIIVICIMTFGIEVYMKRKEYLVNDGANLFNYAFFQQTINF